MLKNEIARRFYIGLPFVVICVYLVIFRPFNGLIFSLIIALAGFFMLLEWSSMFVNKGYQLPFSLLAIFYFIFTALFYFFGDFQGLIKVIVVLFFLLFIILFVSRLYFGEFNQGLLEIVFSLIGVFYFGIVWNTLILFDKLTIKNVQWHLLLVLFMTWGCDIGAFFAGKFLKSKSLNFPLSPKKTVAGFIGGVLFSYMILFIFWTFLEEPLFLIGLVVPFLTILGDLFESLIKRFCDVKDSSSILPGHGGVFDALDALCLTVPFYYNIITMYMSMY